MLFYKDGQSTMLKFTMIVLMLVPFPILNGMVTLPSRTSRSLENSTKSEVTSLRRKESLIVFQASKNRMSIHLTIPTNIWCRVTIATIKMTNRAFMWGWINLRAFLSKNIIFKPISLESFPRLLVAITYKIYGLEMASWISTYWALLELPIARLPMMSLSSHNSCP